MRTRPSAKCFSCDDRLGRPQKAVEKDGEEFTIYKCVICENKWLRPHRP